MLFIYPMWDSETQRIGKKLCTPLGSMLHGIADLLGFIGLLLLIFIGLYVAFAKQTTIFDHSIYWLFAFPFGLGLIGEFMYRYSWKLAAKKEFHYDYKTGEASWMEDGQRRIYKWKG